ncbi:putative methyltransferase [Sphingomonas sp. F9_3S_D5_B_2]
MRTIAVSAIVVAMAVSPVLARPAAAPTIATAVAMPGRSADNVKLDESRKPAEVLAFLGVKRGMHALDLFGANRYWSEIMAPVVGPTGSVAVWEPTQFYDGEGKTAFAAFKAKNPNVSIVSTPFEAPVLPKNRFDVAMLNLNYHDVYWQSDKYKIPKMNPARFLKTVYGAMKPGGVIGVIDHAASPNSDTRATVEKYHRIDPAVVKADFRRAGFVLVGSSDILRNSADRHDLPVFDAKIRGKTDRFFLKFKKPR